MNQDIINNIMEEIKKTRIFTTDYIAGKLGVEKELVEKVLGILLAQGKIKKIRLKCPCNKCIFDKICGLRNEAKYNLYIEVLILEPSYNKVLISRIYNGTAHTIMW